MALADHPSIPKCSRCPDTAVFRVSQLRRVKWGTRSSMNDMCRGCAIACLRRPAIDPDRSVLIQHLLAGDEGE